MFQHECHACLAHFLCCIKALDATQVSHDPLLQCRFANSGPLGFQEKLILQNKAKEAMEKGEKIPDEPGMQQALKDMDNGKTVDAELKSEKK